MTDAHWASCAVWARPLLRSPPEQAKATGKWRDNIRRGGARAVSQSEQPETRIFPSGSRHQELAEAVMQDLLVRPYSLR